MATAAGVPAHGRGDISSERAFFGHPRGLSTLFFSEMWERFSYYGMRGFLILYMTAPAAMGGMGMDAATAGPIYGMYTSMVYLTNLPGGWIADRLIGQRRAVLIGGILIACGHYSLAVPTVGFFYFGLCLIVLGTGLLKPNMSVMVGQLYPDRDVRRDAGFSIYYMGINTGALVGPLITGYLAQDVGFRARLQGWGFNPNASWHWGFAAAGVGMTLGLIQYVLGARALGTAGLEIAKPDSPAAAARTRQQAIFGLGGGLVALAVLGILIATGALPISIKQITGVYGYILCAIVVAFFLWLFLGAKWTREERNRLWMIFVYFVSYALFISIFDQAGSTLNLFAERSTNNVLPGYGPFPASWWQSVNPLGIIVFAPIFAWLWVKLGSRASTPAKFAWGLIGVGLGFLVLIPGAQLAATGVKVGVSWLFIVYLIHTWAELSLSPVGLSAMTKLAPLRIMSLVMGVWFLGASIGDYLGGLAASFYESMSIATLLGAVAVLPIVAGVAMFIFRKPLTRLEGGAD
jgi:POT family proton-dependent oligopeptide transporter